MSGGDRKTALRGRQVAPEERLRELKAGPRPLREPGRRLLEAEPVVLDLRVNIHDPLTIAPALVFWKRGEPGAAKTVQLTADADQHVRIKSVVSSNPRVVAKLETIKAGEQYVVSVTPADTTQKESAEISVLTDFPADAPRAYTIHARVK